MPFNKSSSAPSWLGFRRRCCITLAELKCSKPTRPNLRREKLNPLPLSTLGSSKGLVRSCAVRGWDLSGIWSVAGHLPYHLSCLLIVNGKIEKQLQQTALLLLQVAAHGVFKLAVYKESSDTFVNSEASKKRPEKIQALTQPCSKGNSICYMVVAVCTLSDLSGCPFPFSLHSCQKAVIWVTNESVWSGSTSYS